jgi:hypothetical protein
MSATGCLKASIVCDLGYNIGTVDSAYYHYRESGPNGLIPGKPLGWTSRATLQYRATLRTVIETASQDLGYGFSVWSLARLNAHLVRYACHKVLLVCDTDRSHPTKAVQAPNPMKIALGCFMLGTG